MPFFTYTDGQILTAEELNSDNQSTLDSKTSSPQVVASTVTFGGLVTTPLSILGLMTLGAATVDNVTVVNGGSVYQVLATDRYVLINTGVATQVTLPATTTMGRIITIKDSKGTAGSATITIVASPNTIFIDGLTHFNIINNFGVISLIWNGSGWSSV